MNSVDFNTNPAGFPLTADEILGFVQSNLVNAITAIAKMMKLDNAILSGCVITGATMTDGYILLAGEVLYMEGGTVASTIIVEQTTTQKANQDGTLVDRIIVRTAKFGTGAGQVNWSTLARIPDMAGLYELIRNLARVDSGYAYMVLKGIQINGGGTILSEGIVLASDRIMTVPEFTDGNPINAANPVYLSTAGVMSRSSSGAAIAFNPDTVNRHTYLIFLLSVPIGHIVWEITGSLTATDFSVNGLGQAGRWLGWAKANGNNGTLDLSAAISGLTAIQRIN